MSLTLMIAASLATPMPQAVRQDDRPPNRQERAAIERVLRENGFVRWDDIELDDGVWEVDDAVTRNGREYDLKLEPRNLRIIRRDPD